MPTLPELCQFEEAATGYVVCDHCRKVLHIDVAAKVKSICANPNGVRWDPGFDCVHRGAALRKEECELCGYRGRMIDVHGCAIHQECTIHAHGIRNATGKLEVCIACEQRQESIRETLQETGA